MTSIVGLHCSDGIVLGTDSAVTFGASGGQVSTIEQNTTQKLRIIDNRLILAGTGDVGLMQRFHASIDRASKAGEFSPLREPIEFGKALARIGITDFRETHLENANYSALVAGFAGEELFLCELDGGGGFQPELKEPDDLWYVSSGIGQTITDPFLALMRDVFWQEGPPTLRGGIFTTLWALKHVCKLNVGGISHPIRIAVLSKASGIAKLLTLEELAEHDNMVEAAMKHFGSFKDILEGLSEAQEVPTIGAA
jgi:20S proteasome alpha/beta subunit